MRISPAKRASFVIIALLLAALVIALLLSTRVRKVENLHPGVHIIRIQHFHKGKNTLYECNEVERYFRIALSKIGLHIRLPEKILETTQNQDGSGLFITYSGDIPNADLDALHGELVDDRGGVSHVIGHAWMRTSSLSGKREYAAYFYFHPLPGSAGPEQTKSLNCRLRLKLGPNGVPMCEINVGNPPSRSSIVPQKN